MQIIDNVGVISATTLSPEFFQVVRLAQFYANRLQPLPNNTISYEILKPSSLGAIRGVENVAIRDAVAVVAFSRRSTVIRTLLKLMTNAIFAFPPFIFLVRTVNSYLCSESCEGDPGSANLIKFIAKCGVMLCRLILKRQEFHEHCES